MALQCAISGDVPKEPVISVKSGAVFEKSVILKHLSTSETDPINDEPLSQDDLVSLNVPEFTTPRVPSATNLPVLLKQFQDEWDASMLEAFELKKQNQQLRQELTQSLYQYDAATRVIARLAKERDQARQALSTLKPGAVVPQAEEAQQEGDVEMAEESDASDIPDAVMQDIEAVAQKLSSTRKGKAKPEDLSTADAIKGFGVAESHKGIHSSSQGNITSVGIQRDTRTMVTVGSDKHAVSYDLDAKKAIATMKGHSKKVNSVSVHSEQQIAVTGGNDTTVRVWDLASGSQSSIISCHSEAVTGVDIHPTGNYVLSCSNDRTWALSDIQTGNTYVQHTDDTIKHGATAIKCHPDGLIFAVGNGDGTIRMWDFKKQNCLATFEGHSGAIKDLAFSENGYYLASASSDSTAMVWDLRKLKSVYTFELPSGNEVNAVSFDFSGSYLAVGGSDLRVYTAKKWQEVAVFDDFKKPAHGIAWGKSASFLVAACGDNTVFEYK